MGEESLEKKWYALHVYSGQENKVKMYLDNEIPELNFSEKIGNVLIPSEKIIEMKDGKKKEKIKTIFPGYMLIEMTLDKETSHFVLDAPGVINFIGTQNKPQTLFPHEVERILGKEKSKESKESVEVPFELGDAIKVIDGPFKDFTGFVEDLNLEKSKVKVMVSIFGRATPVELDFLQVELEK